MNGIATTLGIVAVWLSAIQPTVAEEIAAQVNGRVVYVSHVAHRLYRLDSARGLAIGEPRDRAAAMVLDQLVREAIVLDYFAHQRLLPSDDEVRLEIERLGEEMAAAGGALQDLLASRSHTMASFRSEVLWQLAWSRFIDRQLVDENLEAFFDRHRSRYDGTRWRVAHLLLRISTAASEQQWQEVEDRARAIRGELVAGRISWEEAVAEFSQGATTEEGGELGWIQYDGAMPDAFHHAASQLRVSEISEPVRTPFGVHLIRCLRIEPGRNTWRDVYDRLRRDATRELFDDVVNRHGKHVEVQFTGLSPYFDRPERRLVRPASPDN